MGRRGATQSVLPGCGWWVVGGYTRQKWGQASLGHDAVWVQVMGRHWGWGSQLWPPGHTGLCLPSVLEEVGGFTSSSTGTKSWTCKVEERGRVHGISGSLGNYSICQQSSQTPTVISSLVL